MYVGSTGDVSFMYGSDNSYIVTQDDDEKWGWRDLGPANQGGMSGGLALTGMPTDGIFRNNYVPAGGPPITSKEYTDAGSKTSAIRSVLAWLADNSKYTKQARVGEIVNVPLFLSAETCCA